MKKTKLLAQVQEDGESNHSNSNEEREDYFNYFNIRAKDKYLLYI